jgi:hypothetical protein
MSTVVNPNTTVMSIKMFAYGHPSGPTPIATCHSANRDRNGTENEMQT